MFVKRLFDLTAALTGLLLTWPLLVAIAIWIRLDSPGPALFRQVRVGRNGTTFGIIKFRTMRVLEDDTGREITVGSDPRITRAGRILRRHKLDELPQLFNVIAGQMSLVGPRPEVPKFVALYPPEVRRTVLSVRPGITDFASIEYRDENHLLEDRDDPEKAYVEEIMPAKLAYYMRYVSERSLLVDLKIILLTLRAVLK